ncbi:MAG: hypothetical protein A2169_06575 [Deltaproteobacteria bacterium RBG_13_47_9]|nr:MAG: hypothetical protein A2169_06575 [Deltaproteobacteria bacterium RBG_13_47_9]
MVKNKTDSSGNENSRGILPRINAYLFSTKTEDVLLCQISVSLIAVFLIFLTACGTTRPSKFYTLNSLQTLETVKQVASEEKKMSVAIGPVEIPDYLDRPQIAVRSSQNELTVNEYERWAGSLRDDITRVLVENLSILLGGDRVSVFPLRPGFQSDYRIRVNLTRFDIMPDDIVSMRAEWAILDKNGVIAFTMRETNFDEHIEGRSYSDKIAALSRALTGLSKDIADGIRFVSGRSVPPDR